MMNGNRSTARSWDDYGFAVLGALACEMYDVLVQGRISNIFLSSVSVCDVCSLWFELDEKPTGSSFFREKLDGNMAGFGLVYRLLESIV